MAKQQSNFNAIIYEIGDELISIYSDDPRNANTIRSKPQNVLFTKMTNIGGINTQLIMFENSTEWEVSNHYKPYSDKTIDKYKDGLNFFSKSITNVVATSKSKDKYNYKIKQATLAIQEEIKEVETFRFKISK